MCNMDYKRTLKENLLLMFKIKKRCGLVNKNNKRCQFLAMRGTDFCPWNFFNGGQGDDSIFDEFKSESMREDRNYYNLTKSDQIRITKEVNGETQK